MAPSMLQAKMKALPLPSGFRWIVRKSYEFGQKIIIVLKQSL